MEQLLEPHHFVVKSNYLIEARYRLSLQESHVILWLLTQIKPEDEDFKEHRLKIDEFAKMVGLQVKGQYSELQKITESLMKRVLKIVIPETGDLLQVSWLSSALYKKRQGCVILSFDPKLKPYLLQLRIHFTKIDIVDNLKLRSIYAVRVFELLIQYLAIGNRTIRLDDIRSFCGIEDKEYKKYFDLKRYVIESAKEEINAKTEYEISYKEIKESRKVAAIEWTIKKKTHFEKMQSDKVAIITKELCSQKALIEQLIEYGFSKKAAVKILQTHEEAIVSNAIKAVDIQVLKEQAKNPKAMLQAAIKEQWHPDRFKSKKKAA